MYAGSWTTQTQHHWPRPPGEQFRAR